MDRTVSSFFVCLFVLSPACICFCIFELLSSDPLRIYSPHRFMCQEIPTAAVICGVGANRARKKQPYSLWRTVSGNVGEAFIHAHALYWSNSLRIRLVKVESLDKWCK